ncbi:glycosyltransferase [Photobacterium sp. DA100]|uniref:glycosyltransferase n=1 Tax=Photobacterium sp. DA100 TaxID=3027472 RepID=UPI002479A038|nr:glycosyltransferase [Photobacterium sp. DA100]WEM41573.1 glycosyltransferase [Photobacterium sp. DA100]
MYNIGIYRSIFPVYSESFITEQTRFLNEFSPVFITRNKKSNEFKNTHLINSEYAKVPFALFGFGINKRLLNNKIDLIHAHFGQDAFYARKLAKKLNVPFLVTFHGQDCTVSDIHKIRSLQISNLNYLKDRKKIFRESAKIIAVSDFVKNKLIEQGCPKEKIITHYIGVDCDLFNYKKKIINKKTKILCVGRHTDKKGIDDLIEACSILKNEGVMFEVIQIGKGEENYTKYLESLVSKYSLNDYFHFIGSVEHSEIKKYFHNSDIFCLPSREAKNGDSEALGLVFNEASSTGLPIVSTKHGGIPEVVIDGLNGFSVSPNSPMELASALKTLIKDEELRNTFGVAGSKLVSDKFNLKKQTIELEKIYKKVVSEWNGY